MADNDMFDDFGMSRAPQHEARELAATEHYDTFKNTPDEVHQRHEDEANGIRHTREEDEARTFDKDETKRVAPGEAAATPATAPAETPEDAKRPEPAPAEAAAPAQPLDPAARADATFREVFSNEQSFTTIENEADRKIIEEAAKRDAEEAAKRAAEPASGATPGNGAAAPASSGADKDAAGAPAKPTGMEEALASIRQTGNRHKTLVIAGDPAIRQAFMNEMMAQKRLHYVGGQPVLNVSRNKALEILKEVAARHDAKSQHAMSVSLEREGGGVMRDLYAGLANNILNRRHTIDVAIVGKEAVITEKLKELGSLVSDLQKNDRVKPAEVIASDGALKLKDDKPVELQGTSRLVDVINDVQAKVSAFRTAEAEKRQEVRNHDNESKYEKMLAAKEKENPGAGVASGKDGAVPVNKNTAELAERIDRGIQNPTSLDTKDSDGNLEATRLLRDARKRKDPAEPEMSSLPDGDRQKAIVQLAALVQKADNKEFDAALKKELDSAKPGQETIRERVDYFVAMEAKRSADFAEKAAPFLKDMVDRQVLTEAQATAITVRIVEAVTAAKETSTQSGAATDAPKAPDAGKDGATPAAPADAVPAKAEAKAEENTAAAPASAPAETKDGDKAVVKDAPQAADATTAQAPAANAQGAESTAATDARAEPAAPSASTEQKAPSADGPSFLAAHSGVQPDVAGSTRADAAGDLKVRTDGAQAGERADAPAVADKPLELRERIAEMVKDGPANLTSEKAHALVSELDGLRSKPLTSLDASAGEKPTQTLARAELLLKEMESGRLGPELKAMAKDLTEPVQKWGQQDAARYEKDPSLALTQRSEVAAQVKATEAPAQSAAPVKAADASTATPSTPAPAKEQALAAADSAYAPATATAKSPEQVTVAPAAPAAKEQAPVAVEAPTGATTAAAVPTSTKATEQVATTPAPAPAPAVAEAAAATLTKAEAKVTEQAAAPASVAAPTAATGKDQAAAVAEAPAAPARVEAPATRANEQQAAAPAASEAAKAAPAADAVQAKPQAPAMSPEQEQAKQRLWETESAGGKLSMMMANPAGSFTNRDKSWNHDAVQRAASEVLRIDPDAVSQLSPAQRTKIAMYSAWVAENARDGKLPGFSSEEGKAQASQLVERAAAIIGKMEDGAKLPADIQKNIDRADRMVETKLTLEKSAGLASEQSRESAPRGAISPTAANALAKDMVVSVYRQAEVSEAQAKYLLKNATNLSADALRDVEPQLRAKTAVAMNHLAQEVRAGSIGEFSKLPAQVQKHATAAANLSENLLTSMGKDPAMRAELNQAYNEMHAKDASASKGATKDVAAPSTSSSAPSAPSAEKVSAEPAAVKASAPAEAKAAAKPEGRSFDR